MRFTVAPLLPIVAIAAVAAGCGHKELPPATTAQRVAVQPIPMSKPMPVAPVEQPVPVPVQPEPAPVPEPPKEKPRTVLAKASIPYPSITIDDVTVSVMSAGTTGNDLRIYLLVESSSDTRPAKYDGSWGDIFNSHASCVDSFGQEMRIKSNDPLYIGEFSSFGLPAKVLSAEYGAGNLEKGKYRSVMLSYPPPHGNAKHFDLDLSGKAVGVSDNFRFRIMQSFLNSRPDKPKPGKK